MVTKKQITTTALKQNSASTLQKQFLDYTDYGEPTGTRNTENVLDYVSTTYIIMSNGTKLQCPWFDPWHHNVL